MGEIGTLISSILSGCTSLAEDVLVVSIAQLAFGTGIAVKGSGSLFPFMPLLGFGCFSAMAYHYISSVFP
jgi:hypothetical protein